MANRTQRSASLVWQRHQGTSVSAPATQAVLQGLYSKVNTRTWRRKSFGSKPSGSAQPASGLSGIVRGKSSPPKPRQLAKGASHRNKTWSRVDSAPAAAKSTTETCAQMHAQLVGPSTASYVHTAHKLVLVSKQQPAVAKTSDGKDSGSVYIKRGRKQLVRSELKVAHSLKPYTPLQVRLRKLRAASSLRKARKLKRHWTWDRPSPGFITPYSRKSRHSLQLVRDRGNQNTIQCEPVYASPVPTLTASRKRKAPEQGSGNQLQRVRTKAATMWVRKTLLNAHLRKATKRQHCLFFTRFGKCNKPDSCKYIHDPDKVAVCTRWLKGTCAGEGCLLQHKAMPHRMPVCSHFLQGVCTREQCPYRHVNVNPKAPVCQRFLRGYCPDGDQCVMKHTYICPALEASGFCAKRAGCRFHHPSTLASHSGCSKLDTLVQPAALSDSGSPATLAVQKAISIDQSRLMKPSFAQYCTKQEFGC